MAIGYKSESGAVWLGLAAAIAIPFIPRSAWMVAAPVWAATSRLVARGARCRVRPANEKSGNSTNKKSCEVIMSANMDANERPVAVVTGTNSGIGFHTAVGLAVEGYVVVCTCRSAVLSSQTAEKIRHEAERLQRQNPHKYANTPKPVLVDGQCPIECDDFASVRQFVKWFTQKYGSRNVQVLVNNAGGMRRELRFSIFNPQLEFHTAVNFLGPMLLTELMLPILEKRGGRVVYVASEAHRFPQMVLERRRFWEPLPRCNGVAKGKLSQALRDLNQGKEGSSGPLRNQSLGKAFVRYGTSKLLNTYHAHVVARRYAAEVNPEHRVYACSLHPGCVATNFSRDLIRWNVLNSIYQIVSLLFLKSWEEGAQTTLHCAMCPREELELVYPASSPKDASQAVSPYFVECANKTSAMLLAYGWDVSEAEDIVAWGKGVLQLS